jgi:hypothetical protein
MERVRANQAGTLPGRPVLELPAVNADDEAASCAACGFGARGSHCTGGHSKATVNMCFTGSRNCSAKSSQNLLENGAEGSSGLTSGSKRSAGSLGRLPLFPELKITRRFRWRLASAERFLRPLTKRDPRPALKLFIIARYDCSCVSSGDR